jgi:hypothetical protein
MARNYVEFSHSDICQSRAAPTRPPANPPMQRASAKNERSRTCTRWNATRTQDSTTRSHGTWTLDDTLRRLTSTTHRNDEQKKVRASVPGRLACEHKRACVITETNSTTPSPSTGVNYGITGAGASGKSGGRYEIAAAVLSRRHGRFVMMPYSYAPLEGCLQWKKTMSSVFEMPIEVMRSPVIPQDTKPTILVVLVEVAVLRNSLYSRAPALPCRNLGALASEYLWGLASQQYVTPLISPLALSTD